VTSIGVRIRSAKRCGEFSAYQSGCSSGRPNQVSHWSATSAVPFFWSSAQVPEWVTIAPNRSVCPAIQLVM
jgi:hypothetical protein